VYLILRRRYLKVVILGMSIANFTVKESVDAADYKRFPKYMRGSLEDEEVWSKWDVIELTETEESWRDRYAFLLSHGYQLRPRYHPDWKPSWIGTDICPLYLEDSISCFYAGVIDAKRVSDGLTVGIKCLRNATTSQNEVDITRLFSSEELAGHPENHCIPLLDVLRSPDEPDVTFLVELWVTNYDWPRFSSVAEYVDFMDQILEGLAFMHRHGVAHRDCTPPNIRMDMRRLHPKVPFHPVRPIKSIDGRLFSEPLTRSQAEVKYYFIDFGISSRFGEESASRLVTGIDGRDQDIPELSDTIPYDPFKVDVKIIGNLFQTTIISKYQGFEAFIPLVEAMTASDPTQRPTAKSCLDTLRQVKSQVSGLALRWTLLQHQDPLAPILNVYALYREFRYRLSRIFRFWWW